MNDVGMANILDGKATAAAVREDVAAGVATLRAAGHPAPGLCVVLVGGDPASQVYVRNKDRAATQAGFEVSTLRLDAETSQADLEAEIKRLNLDSSVHGILVQLPLPKGLDADSVLRGLDPAKDVDGLTATNVAALVTGSLGHVPCTPAGCIEILDRHGQTMQPAAPVGFTGVGEPARVVPRPLGAKCRQRVHRRLDLGDPIQRRVDQFQRRDLACRQ